MNNTGIIRLIIFFIHLYFFVVFCPISQWIFSYTVLKGGEYRMDYSGGGSGFALVVVLFILLIIIGASFAGGGY
jgi:uncharacterized protein (TIGR01732 family)